MQHEWPAVILMLIAPDERLQIIKQFESIRLENGRKVVDNWLYIKHPSGALGYVNASDIRFKNMEHTAILKTYYEKPPLSKQDWRSTAQFVGVKK